MIRFAFIQWLNHLGTPLGGTVRCRQRSFTLKLSCYWKNVNTIFSIGNNCCFIHKRLSNNKHIEFINRLFDFHLLRHRSDTCSLYPKNTNRCRRSCFFFLKNTLPPFSKRETFGVHPFMLTLRIKLWMETALKIL